MKQHDAENGEQARPEGERDRASNLAAAILRISLSLDLKTVLSEIVAGARELTGARRGIIAEVDESGVPGDYFLSGFTPDEERELVDWPEGLWLVEHLHELTGPLRVEDFQAYVREFGLAPPSIFPTAFQGTPVRYRDASVGYLFLGDKAEGAAFTAADEEMLLLFASQAAAAIGNARVHHREQRARMDLETLVDTSPVGVVVFDGRSGRMVSSNREAHRIVQSLLEPGRPLEELLETAVCRRADGREVSLAEFPLVQQFESAQVVRSEEIVVSVPDGRSVRTLINVSPIKSGESVTESVVVTLQDLAPLEEVESARTQFLGLVSHELRAPLSAIKGSAVTLLDETRLDSAEMREFHRIILEQANQMRGLIADLLDAGRIDTGTLSVSPEPTSVANLVEQARTTFLGGDPSRRVAVDLAEDLPPVMADRHRIVQVLNNLLDNAARHAVSSSAIRVAAVRDGQDVVVSVADDGMGMAPERLAHLFDKHGSGTASHGLGLAICKGLVEAHGGRIRAASEGPGRGTTISFTLPAAQNNVADFAPAATPAPASPGAQPRVLVVDDDPNTLRFVRNTLARAGYEVLVSGNAKDIAHLIRDKLPQLVLLDLVLPDDDGLELLQSVPELAELPVILITAYGRDETIARAFELGVQDYVVKPFSPTELVARVRAARRRNRESEPFVLGGLLIDFETCKVTMRGEEVQLTATEYEVLRLLAVSAGKVVPHKKLLERVWNKRENADPNLLRIFVHNLRRKLGDDATSPNFILNHRGIGYRMPVPDES